MKTVLLGELVDISSSKRIFYSEYVKSGVPFYRSKEVIEKAAGKKVTSTGLFITEKRFNEISSKFGAPKEGDLLLTSVGTLGVPYLVQKDERLYFKDGNLTWFRNFSPQLNRNYLLYWITSRDGKGELLNHTIGSTQKALTIQGLKKVRIPLPTINTQNQIVNILGTIDKKIELNRLINETLEKIGQALFKHYFTGNPEAKIWPKATLKDVIDSVKLPLKAGEGLSDRIYLPVDKLQMNSLTIHKPLSYKDAKSSLLGFEKNDILVGAMRVYFHRVNMAPQKGVTRTTTFVLRPKNVKHWAYSVLLINQDSTIDYANTHSKGTTMPYAIWENGLANMKIKLPPDEKLIEFNNIVLPILEKIRDSYKDNETLIELRDSLLPRLISGKKKV